MTRVVFITAAALIVVTGGLGLFLSARDEWRYQRTMDYVAMAVLGTAGLVSAYWLMT